MTSPPGVLVSSPSGGSAILGSTTLRVLMLTQVLPYPLDAGPKVRAYYVLRHLARKGHRVTLLSFVRAGDRPEQIAHLRRFSHRVETVPITRSRMRDVLALLKSLTNGTPFLIARDWVPEMAERLEALHRDEGPFDLVHADQLWMAPYALKAREADSRVRTILDQHNAVCQIPRRLAQARRVGLKKTLLNLEARKLADYEARACDRFDRVVWVSAEDQEVFRLSRPPPDEPGACDAVIPICIDPDEDRGPLRRNRRPFRLTFLGGLHWPPNADGLLWFVRDIWPLIAPRLPQARLTVIGKHPPRGLPSPAAPTIEVTGYVEDPTPYLADTAVFIIPLRAAGGMRVKILDAWAWGLPIVSTRIGAEGVAADSGSNILLADTAESFAEAVVRIFNCPETAEQLSRNGRATVESRYHWRRAYHAWDQVYQCASSTSFPTRPA